MKIVATYLYASSQGQRTHSARTTIYFCHAYREHTSTEGKSIASQSQNLTRFLTQWEKAACLNNPAEPNEVHVCVDMNLDALQERWLQPDYRLISLSRLVQNICNANNFSQLVTEAPRLQYNSITNITGSFRYYVILFWVFLDPPPPPCHQS